MGDSGPPGWAKRTIDAVREHPSATRRFVHGTSIPVVLGVLAAVTVGAAAAWTLALWLVSYILVTLVVEVAIRPVVQSSVVTGGDSQTVYRSLDPVDQLIAQADRIELLGGTLKTFTERSANISALHAVYRTGIQVRILMMDPTGDGVRVAAAERQSRGTNADAADLQHEITQSIGRLLQEFSSDELGRVLRFYPFSPHSSIYRYGDRYVVAIYTFGRGGSSPTFTTTRYKDEEFCRALDRGFEELWQAPSTEVADSALLARLAIPPRGH